MLLNAFGGRFTTRDAICTECNHRTNEIADNKFADDYAFWRNYLSLNAGDGDPPPTIRGLRTKEEQRYDLAPGGQPVLRELTFKPDPVNSGSARLAGPAERLARQIPKFAKGLGISAESFADGIHGGFSERATLPGSIQRQFTLSETYHFRSITKSALILWALEHGNDEICGKRFRAARRFALGGAVEVPCVVASDCRTPPIEPPSHLERGRFDHSIAVWSSRDKSVYCHMRLFGFFGYSLRIGTTECTPRATMLWLNPVAGRFWRGTVPMPEGWQFEVNHGVEVAKKAIAGFMAEAERRHSMLALEAVIDRAIHVHLPMGEVITQERLIALFQEVEETLAHMFSPDAAAGDTVIFPRPREQILRQLGLTACTPSGTEGDQGE